MKRFFPVFLATVVALSGVAYGATRAASSIELDTMPSTRTRADVDYTKYKTHSVKSNYDAKDAKNIYYSQPSKRSDLYKEYNSAEEKSVRTTRSETLRTELKRKYFIAHPFFQPLQYKFGSITDFSYDHNGYDMAFNGSGAEYTVQGQSGNWKANGFAIKEDLSFGITDRLAIMGMLRYNTTEHNYDWSNGTSNSKRDNGLNFWGLGLQGRFLDSTDWIGMASFYFEHQKDTSNDYVLELKGGYKVSHSTIYALGRAWLVDFDKNTYGNEAFGKDSTGKDAAVFLAYKRDVNTAFYGELGIGDFSVLAEDWTLNLEALFGFYDWHNQFSVKGAFGWQPNDWFALNLYGKVALYDSAKDKDVDVLCWQSGTTPGWGAAGNAHLSNYSEYSVGLQAMFMF